MKWVGDEAVVSGGYEMYVWIFCVMSAQQIGHLWRDSEHFLQVTKCPQGMKTIAMSLSMHTLQSFSRCSFSSFFRGSSAESHEKKVTPWLAVLKWHVSGNRNFAANCTYSEFPGTYQHHCQTHYWLCLERDLPRLNSPPWSDGSFLEWSFPP